MATMQLELRRDAHGDRCVGHILRAAPAPEEKPWFWTIFTRGKSVTIDRGYAATREQAIADLFAKKGSKMKNLIVVALIVDGAIIVALPIAILGLIKVVWDLGICLTTPSAPIVAEKIRQLAEVAELRISGQADKQTKLDRLG